MKHSQSQGRHLNDDHLDLELLSAYIDGEVTPAEQQQVERHLALCTTCVEELESLRWTVRLLHEVPPVPVPHPFAVRRADLERPPRRRRFTLPRWVFGSLRWATAVTALLFLLVLSADLLNVTPFAPGAPKAVLPAPAMEKMVVETVVVEKGEKKAEQKAVQPSSAKGTLTPLAPAARAPAENELELATAPEVAGRPEPVEKRSSQPTVVLRAPRPQTALTPSGEGQEQTLLASPAERSVLPLDPLRLLEIALAGLLGVLISLLLWVRRWVRET